MEHTKVFEKSKYSGASKRQIRVSTLYIRIITNNNKALLEKHNIHNINDFVEFFNRGCYLEYQNCIYTLKRIERIKDFNKKKGDQR